MTTITAKNEILRQAREIAGCAWDDRDATGTLAEQLRRISDAPPLGGDSDLNDDDRDALRDLADRATVTVRAWDDGSSEETICEIDDDYAAAAEELWDGADYGDGDYRVHVSWEATDGNGYEIDSGSFVVDGHAAEPECPEAAAHDWTSEFEGGCRENPGVWSTGGTSMLFVCRCRHCGMERREKTTGSQHNPGECDTTTYSEPDPEWVAEHIED